MQKDDRERSKEDHYEIFPFSSALYWKSKFKNVATRHLVSRQLHSKLKNYIILAIKAKLVGLDSYIQMMD